MYEIKTWKNDTNFYRFITINSDNNRDLLLLDVTSTPFLYQDKDGFPIYFEGIDEVLNHIKNKFYNNVTIRAYDKIYVENK